MNNNEKSSLKRKGTAIVAVICFVAVVSVVSIYTLNNYNRNTAGEQLAKENTVKIQGTSQETNTNEIVLPQVDESTTTQQEEHTTQDNLQSSDTTPTTGNAKEVYFSEDSVLDWPASGNVLLGYSMDQTVYFQTLDQYKYNPAMIISGEVGEMIGAAAPGIVTNIEQNAKTGVTVTLDMGNGYSAVYGQLKDVPLEIGDYLEKGHVVGYLNEPTKYYSVEGPNLYFEVLKDDSPVDPTLYME